MDDKIIYGLEVRTRCLIVTPKLKWARSKKRGIDGPTISVRSAAVRLGGGAL